MSDADRAQGAGVVPPKIWWLEKTRSGTNWFAVQEQQGYYSLVGTNGDTGMSDGLDDGAIELRPVPATGGIAAAARYLHTQLRNGKEFPYADGEEQRFYELVTAHLAAFLAAHPPASSEPTADGGDAYLEPWPCRECGHDARVHGPNRCELCSRQWRGTWRHAFQPLVQDAARYAAVAAQPRPEDTRGDETLAHRLSRSGSSGYVKVGQWPLNADQILKSLDRLDAEAEANPDPNPLSTPTCASCGRPLDDPGGLNDDAPARLWPPAAAEAGTDDLKFEYIGPDGPHYTIPGPDGPIEVTFWQRVR